MKREKTLAGVGVLVGLSSVVILWGREVVSWRPVHIGQALSEATFVLSPDGRYLASSINWPKTLLIDTQTGQVVLERISTQPFAEEHYDNCVFSRDSKRVAFVRQRRWIDANAEAELAGPLQVEVLALPSLKRLSFMQIEYGYQLGFRVSPQLNEGLELSFGSDDAWDVATGKYRGKVSLHPRWQQGIDDWNFSPDGSRVIVESQALALYRTSDRKRLQVFPPIDGEPRYCPVVSPDNTLVADSDDQNQKHSRFMSVESGRVLWTGDSAIFAFSPDSKRVAIVEGSQIKVRNALTGTLVRPLITPPGQTISWLGWTPDGNFMYAASNKGALWRLRVR